MKPIAVTPPFITANEYLTKRGFANGLADVHKFGVRLAQVKDVIPDRPNDARFGLAFPYFSVSGNDLSYATIRVFDAPKTPGTFASVVGTSDSPKLLTPKDRPPQLYIPKGIDWDNVPKNAEIQVHESVVKCLAAVAKGYLAVGINGCWGWTSRRFLQPLLTGFASLPIMTRSCRLVAVFDSNANVGAPEYEDNVGMAVIRFGGAVEIEFHRPLLHRRIPNGPGGSWGYDDWAGAGGGLFEGPADEVEANGARASVDYLNSKICFLTHQSIVVSLENPSVTYKVGDARNVFAPVSYLDEEDRLKPAFEAWLRHGKRRWAQRLDYRPGQEAFKDEEFVNTWRGWGCEPKAGPVGWWEDLLTVMDSPKVFEQSIAWRLQNPMAKPSSLVNFLIGPQGTGKSSVAEILRRVVGTQNYYSVSGEQLASQFTDYLESFFNVVDDLGKLERKYASRLNGLITSENLLVNRKNRQPYHITNRVTWLFTSNERDSLPLREGDRRWHVIKMGVSGMNWPLFWKAVDPSALFARLLGLDVSSFSPYAPAPVTEGQREMAEATRNPLEDFCFRDLPFILERYGRKCVTATEVVMLFNREVGSEKDLSAWSPKRASDILVAQHWGKVREGSTIKVEGRPLRFWSRDKAFLSLSSVEVADHVKQTPLFGDSKHG